MNHSLKKERFDAVFSGNPVDRPLTIAWRHFVELEKNAMDLADATLAFTRQFDLDMIKFTPRATHYAEVWGNQYDYENYQGVLPKQTRTIIESSNDLWAISPKNARTSLPFAEQLEAITYLRQEMPDTPLIQTVFSPLAVLLFIAGQMPYNEGEVYGSRNPVPLQLLLSENRAGVHHALHAIALTIADYVTELQQAGAAGIFYSIMGTAHPKFFNLAAFNELSRPYDSIVLNAAKPLKTILHTCGEHSQPDRFNDYEIDGISWDTKAPGNPGLDFALKPVKVCGVDHTLFATNDLNQIQEQAINSLTTMKNQPFILAPNCSLPNNVTNEGLHTFRNSVKKS